MSNRISDKPVGEILESNDLPDTQTVGQLKNATAGVYIQHYKQPTQIVVVLALDEAAGAIRMQPDKWFNDSPNPLNYRLNNELAVGIQLSKSEWKGLRAFWTEQAQHYH